MTRDDVIRMAREAGGFNITPAFLERFATLVAAAEREACAKVCEERGPARVLSGEDCAALIRARGEDLLSKTRSHDAARQDVDDAWEQAIK
jgi:hypothetical protein